MLWLWLGLTTALTGGFELDASVQAQNRIQVSQNEAAGEPPPGEFRLLPGVRGGYTKASLRSSLAYAPQIAFRYRPSGPPFVLHGLQLSLQQGRMSGRGLGVVEARAAVSMGELDLTNQAQVSDVLDGAVAPEVGGVAGVVDAAGGAGSTEPQRMSVTLINGQAELGLTRRAGRRGELRLVGDVRFTDTVGSGPPGQQLPQNVQPGLGVSWSRPVGRGRARQQLRFGTESRLYVLAQDRLLLGVTPSVAWLATWSNRWSAEAAAGGLVLAPRREGKLRPVYIAPQGQVRLAGPLWRRGRRQVGLSLGGGLGPSVDPFVGQLQMRVMTQATLGMMLWQDVGLDLQGQYNRTVGFSWLRTAMGAGYERQTWSAQAGVALRWQIVDMLRLQAGGLAGWSRTITAGGGLMDGGGGPSGGGIAPGTSAEALVQQLEAQTLAAAMRFQFTVSMGLVVEWSL